MPNIQLILAVNQERRGQRTGAFTMQLQTQGSQGSSCCSGHYNPLFKEHVTLKTAVGNVQLTPEGNTETPDAAG